MAKIDNTFQELFREIFETGFEYDNKRRGVKRLQISANLMKHKRSDGFPALTLKKTNVNSIITELIWFLRGDNDIAFLRKNNVKIWDKDAYNWHLKQTDIPMSFDEFSKIGTGSVGANYSVQWRNYNNEGIDQIQLLIDGMRKDIMGSRLIVNAWNPSQLEQTALPPCHTGFQVIGEEDGFSIKWNQRSVDTFLGLPFNIASYFALGLILEKMTGHKFNGVIGSLACIHFYDNQYQDAKEFCLKSPFKYGNCELNVNYDLFGRNADVFHELEPHHFELIRYNSDDFVKVDMLAPTSL